MEETDALRKERDGKCNLVPYPDVGLVGCLSKTGRRESSCCIQDTPSRATMAIEQDGHRTNWNAVGFRVVDLSLWCLRRLAFLERRGAQGPSTTCTATEAVRHSSIPFRVQRTCMFLYSRCSWRLYTAFVRVHVCSSPFRLPAVRVLPRHVTHRKRRSCLRITSRRSLHLRLSAL